jgi:Arc/MetJ-type ribon-helix-helix transcriptional regulator
MHVELSPEAQKRVESLVASGEFETVEGVIDAALDRLLIPIHKFTAEELAPMFERGREEILAGKTRPADAALVAELRAIVEAKGLRRRQS